MDVLIVGAGAVGLTYGYRFRKGGAKVRYLVKPAHVDGLKNGVTMLRHNLFLKSLRARPFGDYTLYTEPDKKDFAHVDQVWITVPSDALQTEWMMKLRNALPTGAVIVGLQPGPDDDARLAKVFGKERMLKGVIGFLAYQYPMDSQVDPKGRSGIAYYLPPTSGSLGPADHHAAISAKAVLAKGGMKISLSDGAAETYASLASLSITHMAALEVAGWSFKQFRDNHNMARVLAREAAVEAQMAMAASNGEEPDEEKFRKRAGWGPMVTRLAAIARGMPLEPYLQFHFTKVGAQTRLMLDQYIERARAHNLSSTHLQSLRKALPEVQK